MAQRDKAGVFLEHLEPLQGALEGYCARWLHNRSDVEDVLQNAVARAFRDFDCYAEGTNFPAWLFRYVHLEILNWRRKQERTRHQELPAEIAVEEAWQMAVDEPLFKTLLDDPEVVLDRCDEVLAEAVRSLTTLERSVMLLQAIGDFKYREMADILQVPIGTVMSSLARARLRLRERLVQYGEEAGILKREAP